MELNVYQKESQTTAIYPNKGNSIVYPTLGLCGESGEFAEKVKKCLRDNNGQVDAATQNALIKELGDVLWYVAACAEELGVSLDVVAHANLAKIASRKERGTQRGSGDDR